MDPKLSLSKRHHYNNILKRHLLIWFRDTFLGSGCKVKQAMSKEWIKFWIQVTMIIIITNLFIIITNIFNKCKVNQNSSYNEACYREVLETLKAQLKALLDYYITCWLFELLQRRPYLWLSYSAMKIVLLLVLHEYRTWPVHLWFSNIARIANLQSSFSTPQKVVVTPVRRSTRRSCVRLPAGLRDHDVIVESVDEIPAETRPSTLFQSNIALNLQWRFLEPDAVELIGDQEKQTQNLS